jgi:hypothetical protein
MSTITIAKGLRYTLTLLDSELKVKQNADLKDSAVNLLNKMNFLKKDKNLLIDVTYHLKKIKKVTYTNPTQDSSVLKLELFDDTVVEFEMTPVDVKSSNALKTQVKQIADYIESNR